MKNIVMGIIFILTLTLLLACDAGAVGENGSHPESDAQDGSAESSVRMLARVDEIADRITVTVLESKYTFGVHWVITSDETEYFGKDGQRIERGTLALDDTVEILYNGQVMMSYPPQIVARKITVK